MQTNHDEFLRIFIGRILDELVREGVFDRANIDNIDNAIDIRMGETDPQVDLWMDEIIKLASRSLPHGDTT